MLDLTRLAIAFVNAGRLDGRQVLTPSSLARLTAPVTPFQSGEGDDAYGLRVYRHREANVVEQGGVDPVSGYRGLNYMVPSRCVAVVVLATRADRFPHENADAALDALLPGTLQPTPRTPDVLPMDSVEMARVVGRYAGGTVLELSVDGGALTLHQGASALPIDTIADGRYVARAPTEGWRRDRARRERGGEVPAVQHARVRAIVSPAVNRRRTRLRGYVLRSG